MLAEAALKNLDIDTGNVFAQHQTTKPSYHSNQNIARFNFSCLFYPALQVYRHIKDVGMVWSLESVRAIEERKLLSGHISLHLSLFDVAQVNFDVVV